MDGLYLQLICELLKAGEHATELGLLGLEMSPNQVEKCEREIDRDFDRNSLNEVEYSQAVWTILSVIEDKFLKFTHINNLPAEQKHIYADVYLNALTHPLRSLFRNNKKSPSLIKNEVIDKHYGWALDWLEKAESYNHFCSIFPLWRNNKIELSIDGNVLNTSDYKNKEIEYEVYNRLNKKDGIIADKSVDPNNLASLITPNVSYSNTRFKLNLNPKLAKILIKKCSPVAQGQYNLPDDWEFSKFTLGEFNKGVYCLTGCALWALHCQNNDGNAWNGRFGLSRFCLGCKPF